MLLRNQIREYLAAIRKKGAIRNQRAGVVCLAYNFQLLYIHQLCCCNEGLRHVYIFSDIKFEHFLDHAR